MKVEHEDISSYPSPLCYNSMGFPYLFVYLAAVVPADIGGSPKHSLIVSIRIPM